MSEFSGPYSRVVDAVDRIADALCDDIPAKSGRVTDACVRIANYYGAEIHNGGNILADALEAIAGYFEGQKTTLTVVDEAALLAALTGEEHRAVITLADDIAVTNAVTIPAGKEVVIYLGDNEITGTAAFEVLGSVTFKDGSVECTGRAVVVSDGGKVVVDGTNITSTTDSAIVIEDSGSKAIINSGTITGQEVAVLASSGAKVIINGGTLHGLDNAAVSGNVTSGKGDINIILNGGELVGSVESEGYVACGVYLPNSGVFTMNGGEITSDGAGIVMRGGTVNLNAGEITAEGDTGVTGKVGDSREVVGAYAIVYDAHTDYPAADTLALNIADGVTLTGTDGDIQTLLDTGFEANITDSRT